MVGKIIKYRLKDFWMIALIELIIVLIGDITMTIAVAFGGKTAAPVGAIMMLFTIIFVTLFIMGIGFQSEFNMAVSMGATRKQYVPTYLLSSFIMVILQMGMVYICYFIETFAWKTLCPQAQIPMTIEAFLFSGYVLPAVILLTSIAMFTGVMVMRAGNKIMWVFWAMWMIICFLPARVVKDRQQDRMTLFATLGDWIDYIMGIITPTAGMILMLAVSAAALAGAFQLIKKQRVTL